MSSNHKSWLSAGPLAALALAALSAFLLLRPQAAAPSDKLGHGGPLESIDYPNAIGTASVPVTLASSTYANVSSALLSGGLPHMALAGHYVPRANGSVLLLRLERSVDGGATYEPYSVIQPTAAGVLIYNSGTSTTPGSPFIVPGEGIGTSTSGTAINFSVDVSVAADYVRLSAKEIDAGTNSSTLGTLNAQILMESN